MNIFKSILLVFTLTGSFICVQNTYAELRDPTQPPAGLLEHSSQPLSLSSIIITHNHKIAVINGLNKRIGDEIFGVKIVAINENTVQLEGPSGKITLFLFGMPIKRMPDRR